MTQRRSAAAAAACFLSIAVFSSPALAASGKHTTSTRRAAQRHGSVRTYALPSRGGSAGYAAANTVGRLAMVTSTRARIHGGPERWGRVLSVCVKGQYLAVSCQTDKQYGVIMVDHSLGFIPKSDVQLLNYQVQNQGDGSPGNAAAGPLGQRLVEAAKQYLEVPYVWGGNTAEGIDCSGLVKAAYATIGISLPRHSGDQAAVGYDVPMTDLAKWIPGDRMYFACHHPEIDHTAMYIGDGWFIHASASHGHQVAFDKVDNPYYYSHLVAVRRSRELLDEGAYASSREASSYVSSVQPNSQPAAQPPATATQTQAPASTQTPAVSETRSMPPAGMASVTTTDPESSQQ